VTTPELVQTAYTTILKHFVDTGRAPHYTELADLLGLATEEARSLQREAAESALACWMVNDTDLIESWVPFSNVPTNYRITINGKQEWYGQ
jgi:hypothetical protein